MPNPYRLRSYHHHRGLRRVDYTDLAVLIAPHRRWANDDYDDLATHAPEVLLGYRVLLTTPDRVVADTQGHTVAKFVVCDGPYDAHERDQVDIALATSRAPMRYDHVRVDRSGATITLFPYALPSTILPFRGGVR